MSAHANTQVTGGVELFGRLIGEVMASCSTFAFGCPESWGVTQIEPLSSGHLDQSADTARFEMESALIRKDYQLDNLHQHEVSDATVFEFEVSLRGKRQFD